MILPGVGQDWPAPQSDDSCSCRRACAGPVDLRLNLLSPTIVVSEKCLVASVALEWHDRGLARTRLSTTVDHELLDRARKSRICASDAELIDEALTALQAKHCAAEIGAGYAVAYTAHPIDEPDEWGDLDSFRRAAAR